MENKSNTSNSKTDKIKVKHYIINNQKRLLKRKLFKNNIRINTDLSFVNSIKKMKDIPSSILEYYFPNYNLCQFIVSKKGELVSSSFCSINSFIPNKDFISLTVKIKNNISFNNNSKDGTVIPIGYSLAKSYAYNNYSIIIVISREEFIDFTINEKDSFNSITNNLGPILNGLLNSLEVREDIHFIKSIIGEIPYIIDK